MHTVLVGHAFIVEPLFYSGWSSGVLCHSRFFLIRNGVRTKNVGKPGVQAKRENSSSLCLSGSTTRAEESGPGFASCIGVPGFRKDSRIVAVNHSTTDTQAPRPRQVQSLRPVRAWWSGEMSMRLLETGESRVQVS